VGTEILLRQHAGSLIRTSAWRDALGAELTVETKVPCGATLSVTFRLNGDDADLEASCAFRPAAGHIYLALPFAMPRGSKLEYATPMGHRRLDDPEIPGSNDWQHCPNGYVRVFDVAFQIAVACNEAGWWHFGEIGAGLNFRPYPRMPNYLIDPQLPPEDRIGHLYPVLHGPYMPPWIEQPYRFVIRAGEPDAQVARDLAASTRYPTIGQFVHRVGQPSGGLPLIEQENRAVELILAEAAESGDLLVHLLNREATAQLTVLRLHGRRVRSAKATDLFGQESRPHPVTLDADVVRVDVRPRGLVTLRIKPA
jgi:hypothetical protein